MSPKGLEVWNVLPGNAALLRRGWPNRGGSTGPVVGDGFVMDTTRPMWVGENSPLNNVGIPVNRELQVIDASAIVQAAGKVHNDYDIQGRLQITAPGQIWNYCRVSFSYTGTDQTGNIYIPINSTIITSPNTFNFCEVAPVAPGDRYAGFFGKMFKLYRCAVARTTDGIDLYNTSTFRGLSTEVAGSWIGYHAWYKNDRGVHNDGTHNDGDQNGADGGQELHGNFWQGARYNALNPNNVKLSASDWMDFILSAGNGTDQLVDRFVTSSGDSVQSGNMLLMKGEQAYPVGNANVHHNWIWNYANGIVAQSYDTQFGQQDVVDVTVANNIFGGRWQKEGSNTFNAIRYDLRTTINGVRRTSTGFYQDTNNNRWDSNANPGAKNPDGSDHAGNLVWHRVNTRLGDSAIA